MNKIEKYIISENGDTVITTIKGYKELLKRLGIEMENDQIRRWVKAGKIKGIEDNSTYGIYVGKSIFDLVFNGERDCSNCRIKERLTIIGNIANKEA